MQEDFRKEFLPLASKPSWVITWLMNIFFGSVLLFMFIVLAVFPFLVSGNIKVFVVVAVLYYPVWVLGMYRLFRYVKKSKGISVTKIMVDDKGIHFYKKDESIDAILYNQLGPSLRSDDYEIYLTMKRKTWILTVGINRNETKVVFDGTDIGSTHYIKNGRALRARFIEGIVRFRPDLKIDPFVFKEFSIHPEKFTFDGKRYLKHVGEAAIIAGIIVLLSLGLMFLVVKV
ncbi:Uncharacterised protein [Chryseobacterium nakagawai]|uniref:Uncharacterized protein n=1 Tax=Chryseobacterium nakagawai TaxID=1241982 RepID=A0AAD1DRG1_CHRNA|nr:hypothetical protein [Chryseobacterium nakagawai]AZA92387.1 hypothetical protein EG343_18075 [Chryseobacterium nakagawai]VEH18950.1 Uncharacterised protein [Chryseobacterium nakagawai]